MRIDSRPLAKRAATLLALAVASIGSVHAQGVNDIREQAPHQNPLGIDDVTGIASSCGDGQASNHVPIATQTSMNYGQSHSILLHSGQEVRDEIDLFIPGRDHAVNIEIKRRHSSRTGNRSATSAFGQAWSFNYQRTLLWDVLNSKITEIAYDRVDTYLRVGNSKIWEGQNGSTDRVIWDGDLQTKPRIWRAGGVELLFGKIGGNSKRAFLDAIKSPAGNQITFQYQSTSEHGSPLDQIVDSYGRVITFSYDHPSFPSAITKITDFDGREVSYSYDLAIPATYGPWPLFRPIEKFLVSCTSPASQDYPDGRITVYEYAYRVSAGAQSDPELLYNLTGVVYPNQYHTGPGAPPGANEPALSWTYYDTSPGTFGYGWVATHTVGSIAGTTLPVDQQAGGAYSYFYTVPTAPSGPNDPAMEVEVTDRRGSVANLSFNSLGQMLSETVVTSLRASAPGGYQRTFTYDNLGVLLTATGAMGDTVSVTYHGNQHSERAGQTKQVSTPDAGRTFPDTQATIAAETIYEPVYNKPFKVIDPRGFEPGNNPADYTTTYIYDYMETIGQSGTLGLLNACLGFDSTYIAASGYMSLDDLLTAAGVVDTGDVNGNGLVDGICGNLVKIIYPVVTLPSQASSVGLSTTQAASEQFRYNTAGQLIWHKDAEDNIHERTYYAESDWAGQSESPGDAASEGLGGLLRSLKTDTTAGSTRNSTTDPTPIDTEQFFLYNTNGALIGAGHGQTSYTRSTPTSVEDARGIRQDFAVNSHDQVVKVTAAATVPSGPGLTAHAYVTELAYDANGNLVLARAEDKDNLSGHTGFTDTSWSYDILNNEIVEVEDVGGLNLTTVYQYDESENLTRIEVIDGTGGSNSVVEWMHDERDIVMSTTRGSGGIAGTVTNKIDLNGNFTSVTDADPGQDMIDDETMIITDGYDRVVELIAADGTSHKTVYDSRGNVVGADVIGDIRILIDGTSAPMVQTGVTLAERTFEFDTRNRLFKSNESHTHYAGLGNGQTQLDSGALGTPADGQVSAIYVYDRLGRTILTVDADAGEWETQYDGAGRVLHEIDPLDNDSKYTYDENGNPLTQVESEKATTSTSFVDVLTYTAAYDSLNRVRETAEPNGQVTKFEYDSRDNLATRIDALNNEVEYRFDRADRLLSTIQYLSAGGTGANASSLDVTQGGDPNLSGVGGPDGKITISQSWDGAGRLKTRTDDRGNVTSYTYDSLDRAFRIGYGDGTLESLLYNKDSELTARLDQAGVFTRYENDSVGRRTGMSVINAIVGIEGTTSQRWSYDGIGRLWSHFDNNDANLGNTYNNVLVEYHLDSLGRRISETQTIGTQPALTSLVRWQGSGRVVSETYPNNRVVDRTYDALDRLSTVSDNVGGTLTLIASRDYVGRGRLLRQEYGNGAVLDKRNAAGTGSISGAGAGFDSNGRTVRHTWMDGSGGGAQMITSYLSAYNGSGGVGTNRRASETREHLSSRTDLYTFDSAYRMTGFTRQGFGGTYPSTRSLDGVDKMHSFLDEGVQRSPQIDQKIGEEGLNQYSSFSLSARTYDDNGGLVDDGNGLELRQDARKRVSRVAQSGVVTLEYAYDATGRRIAKVDPATTLLTDRYLYGANWRVLEERDSAGAVTRQFVDGDGIDEHLQMRSIANGGAASDYFYHCSDHGFVGGLSDATGTVVEYYEYKWLGEAIVLDAFGVPTASPSGVGNPYLFQGRRCDSETGLYHFRNRQYDATIGEFLSIDSTGLWRHGQGNGYSAFSGDPWNWRDPYGTDGFWSGAWNTFVDTSALAVGMGNSVSFGLVNKFGNALYGKNDPYWSALRDNAYAGHGDVIGDGISMLGGGGAGKVITKATQRGLDKAAKAVAKAVEKKAAKAAEKRRKAKELADKLAGKGGKKKGKGSAGGGKKAKDSGPNMPHGDKGRAGAIAVRQIKAYRECLDKAIGRAAKRKIKSKIRNVQRDAASKKKGGTDGRRKKDGNR